jgi:transposase
MANQCWESTLSSVRWPVKSDRLVGIGVIGATALAMTLIDPSAFKSGRELAAWIGLVPRQNSTGGKMQLGGISKQGDRY